jgi:hypothetical protein
VAGGRLVAVALYLRRGSEDPTRAAAYRLRAARHNERYYAKGEDRRAVIDAFFKTKDRESVLSTYSIDQNADTMLKSYGGNRLDGGT